MEGETNKTYSEFKVIEYRQQIVQGVFYLVKVINTGLVLQHIINHNSKLKSRQSDIKNWSNKHDFLFSEEPFIIKQEFSNAVSSVQVHVGGSDFLHIYVFQSPLLGGKAETILKRVEHHKDEDPLDPIRLYHWGVLHVFG